MKTPPSFKLTVVVIALAVLSSMPASALTLRSYNATDHNRFTLTTGWESAPAFNTSSIAASYDQTGIGWNSDGGLWYSATMITDMHFVTAKHAKPSVGGTFSFLNADGDVKTYTVASYDYLGGGTSDIAIGTFTAAIASADKIAFYSILDLGAQSNYIGEDVLMTGLAFYKSYWGESTITGFNDDFGSYGNVAVTTYGATGDADDAFLRGGDSGGSVFIATDGGELGLMGVNHAVSDTTSPFDPPIYSYHSNLPSYLSEIQTLVAADGRSINTITTLAVPEPGTYALLALGTGLLLLARFGLRREGKPEGHGAPPLTG